MLKVTRYAVVYLVVICFMLLQRGFGISNDTQKSDDLLQLRDVNGLLCLEQSWKYGHWSAFSHNDKNSYIRFLTPDNKYLCINTCCKCGSMRIIDPNNFTERIILSYEGKLERCAHDWKAAISQYSFDPIRAGDILLILYNNQIYVLLLTNITESNLDDQEISYKQATIPISTEMTLKYKLNDLNWTNCKAKHEISIGGRGITFYVNSYPDKNIDRFITIEYDELYGNIYIPSVPRHENIAHIAIVHKNDLSDSNTIDVTNYRFKTWEDGLGNLCGKDESQNSSKENRPFYLNMHTGFIQHIIAAPDGSFIVSSGEDQRVIIKPLDQAIMKIIGPFSPKQVNASIAISKDGKNVLLDSSIDSTETIFKIMTSDGQYENTGKLPFLGMIAKICYLNDKDIILCVTSHNQLIFYDLKKSEVISERKIFGGFLGSIAVSPDQQFVAAISRNIVDKISAEPCKLSIFDKTGVEVFSYQFNTCGDAYNGKLTFLQPNRLALCVPYGEMWKWTLEPMARKWEFEKKIKIPSGPLSAIEASNDGKIIWIGRNRSVIAIDSVTGDKLSETIFDVGEIKTPLTNPITVITRIPKRNMLAIGLGDGRIALLPIPAKLESAK